LIDSGPQRLATRLPWCLVAVAPLAVALGATGCFSDRGVAVEIDVGETGATEVELYLGTASCDSKDNVPFACSGIGPKSSTAPLKGAVWFRDALLPETAEVKGHTATFQLRADTPSTVPIVIAVGRLANGMGVGTATLTNLDVPAHGARIIAATLVPARQAIPGEIDTTTEDRVLVWNKLTPPSSCVMVEHWASGKADRTFVVPLEDPDCDDVPAPECDPLVYHGAHIAGSGTPDCFAGTTAGTQGCVLGSHGCSDLDPQNKMACAPQRDRVCVPDLFCDAASCGQYNTSCLKNLVITDSIPHVDCDIPTLPAPTLDLCLEHATTIDLATYYQGACDQQPKISALSLEGFDTHADFGGATMELQSPRPLCQFNLQWKSGTRVSLSPTDYGLIELPSSKGAMLIPIVFHFYPGMCATKPFHCAVKGSLSDSLWKCAQ
jgi:hypothetical protein